MAKGKAAQRATAGKKGLKGATPRRSVKRPSLKARPSRPSTRLGTAPGSSKSRGAASRKKPAPKRTAARQAVSRRTTPPTLDRARRTLDETVPTPPSSLNMRRQGTAARTGRAELAERLREHGGITPVITGGDVDADWENAYFSGDEAPGGDNPTPDQDVVDDIGAALGVKYEDNEELKAADKVVERDKHRWELDPASSEDYKDRK
jgi:hypothetical protein